MEIVMTMDQLSKALLEELHELYPGRTLVHPRFKVLEIINNRNGCCSDLPYLLTVTSAVDGRHVYSCQCACGGWCTTGFFSPEDAEKEYRRMSTARPPEPEAYTE